MGLICKLKGHQIELRLTLILKGTPAQGDFGGNRAIYGKTYYGAEVTCKRCREVVAEKSAELPE